MMTMWWKICILLNSPKLCVLHICSYTCLIQGTFMQKCKKKMYLYFISMCKVLSINLRKSVQIPIFINPQHLYYLHLCLVSNQSSPLCSGSARFLYQFGFGSVFAFCATFWTWAEMLLINIINSGFSKSNVSDYHWWEWYIPLSKVLTVLL